MTTNPRSYAAAFTAVLRRDLDRSHREPVDAPNAESVTAVLAKPEAVSIQATTATDELGHARLRIGELEGEVLALRWRLHFEFLYRLIFGTQIGALQFLRIRGDTGATLGDLGLFYGNHIRRAIETKITAPFVTQEGWIAWPLAQFLVSRDEGGTFRLTEKGAAFLAYLEQESVPTDKPW
jgi:hypothetical protein